MTADREVPDMSGLTHNQAITVACDAFDAWLDTIATVRRPVQGRSEVAREAYMGTMLERAAARARQAREGG